MAIQAVILAGGSSRRMGNIDGNKDKVTMKIGTTRFVDVVAEPCAKRGLNPLLLGRTDDPHWPGVVDPEPGGGPLAALAALWPTLPENVEEILVLAADMPLLAGADIDWLLAQPMPVAAKEQTGQAVVPQHKGFAQWAFARYHRSTAAAMAALVDDNRRALQALADHLCIVQPMVPEITGERLLNVNTEADLDYATAWFHQRGCACPEDP